MLQAVYITFAVIAFISAILCVITRKFAEKEEDKADILFFGLLSGIIFFILGLYSVDIDVSHCEWNSTSETIACADHTHEEQGPMYLFWGLGLIMFVYTIYSALNIYVEEVNV